MRWLKGLEKPLDNAGGKDVKIIVSSGFSAEKIRKFEEANTPVDSYWCWSGNVSSLSAFSRLMQYY
nr:hypothetical protein [Mycoplasmopsis bovis]